MYTIIHIQGASVLQTQWSWETDVCLQKSVHYKASVNMSQTQDCVLLISLVGSTTPPPDSVRSLFMEGVEAMTTDSAPRKSVTIFVKVNTPICTVYIYN